MKVNLKLLGGILLIVGTSLGGGILALPVATAESGYFNSVIAIVICWMAMTACAFYILEVNLHLPKGANMVSMAEKTLGQSGKVFTWIVYLLLLYSLLSAYVAGGSDIFQDLLHLASLNIPEPITTSVYVCLFAFIVYSGIKTVDTLNSVLMYVKLFIYFLLLWLIFPHIQWQNLTGGTLIGLKSEAMLLVTSFGYAIIVPSLREYFEDDIPTLKKVIFIGSLFPLLCYLVWVAVIMGAVGTEGKHGLAHLLVSEHQTSGLVHAIEYAAQKNNIANFFRFFSSISMLTAFLGVSLCLFDFLADGIKLKKAGLQGLSVCTMVFLPPLLLVLFKPGIYIAALQYAGISCVLLLLILPALMAYKARSNSQLDTAQFKVPGGLGLIQAILVFSLLLLGFGIYSVF